MTEEFKTCSELALDQLYAHAARIARENNDVFVVRVTTSPQRGDVLTYEVSVVEEQEGHCFSSGVGPTIVEAANQAAAGLDEACNDWGYQYVN